MEAGFVTPAAPRADADAPAAAAACEGDGGVRALGLGAASARAYPTIARLNERLLESRLQLEGSGAAVDAIKLKGDLVSCQVVPAKQIAQLQSDVASQRELVS